MNLARRSYFFFSSPTQTYDEVPIGRHLCTNRIVAFYLKALNRNVNSFCAGMANTIPPGPCENAEEKAAPSAPKEKGVHLRLCTQIGIFTTGMIGGISCFSVK
jgi:hypothetical protein